jgi:hypothetical protein
VIGENRAASLLGAMQGFENAPDINNVAALM